MPAATRGPLGLLNGLEAAVRMKKPEAFIALFSPHCRRSCLGMHPFPLDRPGPGSLHVMAWTPTLGKGGLVEALGRLLFSYGELKRLELRPLGLRTAGIRANLVVRLHLEGDDLAGRWRTDQGMIRLGLRRDNGLWRVHSLDLLTLHSAWRSEAPLTEQPLSGLGLNRQPPPRRRFVDLGWPGDLLPDPAWASLDADSDGDMDLITSRGEEILLLESAGGRLQAARPLLRVKGCGGVTALVPGDRQGDGRVDLFVGCARAGSGIWLNGEHGWSLDPSAEVKGSVASATWADLDGEGGPDLYVVRRRRPVGAGSRDVILSNPGMPAAAPPAPGLGVQACAADLDLDGKSELVVLGQGVRPRLWQRGEAGAGFTEVGARLGLSAVAGATACAVADVDGDGRLDLVLGGRQAERGYLLRRAASRTPVQWLAPVIGRQQQARLASLSRGDSIWLTLGKSGAGLALESRRLPGVRWTTRRAGAMDLDRDGAVDLLLQELHLPPEQEARWWRQFHGPALAGKKPRPLAGVEPPEVRTVLLSNVGGGLYLDARYPTRLPAAPVVLAFPGPGASLGRPHLLLEDPRTGGASLLGTSGEQGGHQLLLRLRAQGANRHAVGSVVKLLAEGRHQVRQAGDASGLPGGPPGYLHFGLGAALRAEEVQVRWPGGKRQRFVDLPVDRLVTLTEGAGAKWDEPGETESEPGNDPQELTPPVIEEGTPKEAQQTGLRPHAWQVTRADDTVALASLAGQRGTLLLIHQATEAARVRTLCQEIRQRLDPPRGIRAYRLGPAGKLSGCGLTALELGPVVMKALGPRTALLPLLLLVDGDGIVVKEVSGGLGPLHLEAELSSLQAR